MFTGIVEEMASIVAIDKGDESARLSIKATDVTEGLGIGDSISVAGACLTVTDVEGDAFSVDVISETLRRTALGSYSTGDGVNVERAMPASGRFDGHIVQGHVDATGSVVGVDDS
ncbi:MAG: riboflavin synthase, partial [Acidimicrobiia bacterium]|nr:riboflavin synthase [Acidimicrobiia bacterium]